MSNNLENGQYMSIAKDFISKRLDATTFCTEFTTLWIQDRDNIYAKKTTWPQPYDEILLSKWQNGEIDKTEYLAQYSQLWGCAEEDPLQSVVNGIHSACSVFSTAPKLEGEMDEKDLREYVKNALAGFLENG